MRVVEGFEAMRKRLWACGVVIESIRTVVCRSLLA